MPVNLLAAQQHAPLSPLIPPHSSLRPPTLLPVAVSVFLYALLTVLFTLAGLGYLLLPQ